MKLPAKKYNVIYADPPWRYENSPPEGGVDNQYTTMELDEIKRLPVNEIAAEDCLLFLWVTFPKLREGLEVIEAWGFQYKTLGFSWIKLNKKDRQPVFGIGYYAKSNAEVCLLGIRGNAHGLVKDNSVSSCILAPRGRHSAKPQEARYRIEKLVGNVPKIELFARESMPGWDSWGNEISNDFGLFS